MNSFTNMTSTTSMNRSLQRLYRQTAREQATRAVFITVLLVAGISAAHAHLMVGQRGTLNFVDSGAFMVLAVPVSSFEGIDDNADGLMSNVEFNKHGKGITATVVERVRLRDEKGSRPLQGIMLVPSIPDHDPLGSAEHLVVMGRFALPEAPEVPEALVLETDLFGPTEAAQVFEITVTRKATDQVHTLMLTPGEPVGKLFPSTLSVFASSVAGSARHTFAALDHLLLLVLVLAGGWSVTRVWQSRRRVPARKSIEPAPLASDEEEWRTSQRLNRAITHTAGKR